MLHDPFTSIEADLLRQLYVEERFTSILIAKRFGCSSTTVLRSLRRFGIRARTPGPAPHRGAPPTRDDWRLEVAYAVGLMATDGNLSSDGRHMSLVSKDRELIETFKQCLDVTSPVRTLQGRTGRTFYRVQ